ncbi:hypothetical protein S7711_09360 [Stachybotrys chartarum IBT 7711]|uniref:Phthiocerol/phthiodiolone dimycocerosyl transferase C-terminal domain-containing protein n=1 Tax=Stachybotrys chartarum (strain CBS 109288 / IBT 7711) TaxID=1280523 RepID=A0A084AYK7_STACB|nr:hypothetical protein S7711_09360 [Stachybotrys chartarum IBT 7711]
MDCTQPAPQAWSRELGGLEKIYRFTSRLFQDTGREHWGLYTVCTLRFHHQINIVAKLTQAWYALRVEHPSLGAIVDDYQADYPPHSFEEWTSLTFSVQTEKTPDDVIADYPLLDLPTLTYFPTTREIMLLVSHWRVDAIGSGMLVDRLLCLTTEELPKNASPGLENISPSLEDAAGAPDTTTPLITETADRVTSTFAQTARNSVGLAYKGGSSTSPSRSAYQSITLTKDETEMLVSACKCHGFSVSAAVYAALGTVIFNQVTTESHDPISDFATIMAVSMRPHLPAPYNSSAHACAAYVSSITPRMHRGNSFAKSAATVSSHFKNWHSKDFQEALREIYKRGSEALLSPKPKVPPPPSPPRPPSGVTLSSLGVINNFLKGCYKSPLDQDGAEISVSSFRFGVSMLTRQILLYVWTFNGQLQLSVNYNEAYYESSTIRGFLTSITGVLERELGTSLSSSRLPE